MYWLIDNRNSARDHRKIKVLNYITYILSLVFVWSFDNEYIVDSITRRPIKC